jgi:hypothetical protein
MNPGGALQRVRRIHVSGRSRRPACCYKAAHRRTHKQAAPNPQQARTEAKKKAEETRATQRTICKRLATIPVTCSICGSRLLCDMLPQSGGLTSSLYNAEISGIPLTEGTSNSTRVAPLRQRPKTGGITTTEFHMTRLSHVVSNMPRRFAPEGIPIISSCLSFWSSLQGASYCSFLPPCL